MRWKIPIGVLSVIALLIPAPSAVAQTGSRLDEATCQEVVYTDIRELFTIDVDTASDIEVRMLVGRIDSVARAELLVDLHAAAQSVLTGDDPGELREFLRTTWRIAWAIDLRITVGRVHSDPDSGPIVRAAANDVLRNGETLDDFLTFLNHGLYVARALDACEQQAA